MFFFIFAAMNRLYLGFSNFQSLELFLLKLVYLAVFGVALEVSMGLPV